MREHPQRLRPDRLDGGSVANNKTRPIPKLSEAEIARFWSRVDKSGGPDACWPWTAGCFQPSGYGHHKCCNGAHLFAATNQENIADRDHKGRVASGDRNGSRTHPERLRRSARPGCISRGMANGSSKLTDADVLEIRRLYREGFGSQQRIADIFGVSQVLVGNIVRLENWTHV